MSICNTLLEVLIGDHLAKTQLLLDLMTGQAAKVNRVAATRLAYM
jgi:hypothetical protein